MRGKIVIGALAALVLAQIVPVSRTNPAVETEVPASPEVRQVLRRSCYDCHSNESRWPWYAYVAPVSWLVAHDVNHARKHVNFSTWNAYDAKERRKKLDKVWEELDDGEMPLWYYLPLHPDARVDAADLRLLHSWTSDASG